LDDGKAPPLREDRGGDGAAVVLLQRGLVIEEVDLRRRARHEEINYALRARGKMRSRLIEQRPEGRVADAEPGLLEEVATCDLLKHRHSLVIVSSRFSSALATSVQAACSAASTPALAYPLITCAARSGCARNCSSCWRYAAARRSSSGGFGMREVTARNPYAARTRTASAPSAIDVSAIIRRASARAASKYASSFNVVSACSGVFVRTRRTVHASRLVESNVVDAGYGAGRRMPLCKPRRSRASAVLGIHRTLLYGFCQMPSGCGGNTLGPPTFGDSSPLAVRAMSRTISASTRNRGPRASSRLFGSRAWRAGVVFEDCR